MLTSTEAALVGRALDDVFAVTTDLRLYSKWNAEVESVSDAEAAALEVGQQVVATYKPFLTESRGTITVIEVSHGQRVVLREEFAGLTSVITHSYEPQDHSTLFTRRVEVAPTGMMRILTPVVRRRVRRSNRRSVANLQRLLERR